MREGERRGYRGGGEGGRKREMSNKMYRRVKGRNNGGRDDWLIERG